MRNTLWTVVVGWFLSAAGPAHADDQAAARKIIDKGIKALGDEAKLTRMKAATWKGKGTLHTMGLELMFTGQWATQGADRSRYVLELDAGGQKFAFLMIYNGDKGWRQINDMTMDLDPTRLNEERERAYVGQLARLVVLRDKAFTLSPLGESKVENKTVVGVKVASKGHRDVSLFFDKETGLPVKVATRVKDDQGEEVNQEAFYSDYKDVEGLKHPAKVTIKRDGMAFLEIDNSDWKLAEKLDDQLFAKP